MPLSGHRALITGAGQGIGRACAETFAERGADLILVDRNADTLSEVHETTAAGGARVLSRSLDLSNVDELANFLDILAGRGMPDILVNNAGFDRPGTTLRINREGFNDVLGIHLTVPLLFIKKLLPEMMTSGWGRIINISSIYGLIGGKGEVAYSTAKAGMIGLTKSVARECGRQGVTVNAVLPGLTRTPTIEQFMADRFKEEILQNTPLGRIAEPEEVAKVVAFLASEDSSYITGAVIPVSGGWGI